MGRAPCTFSNWALLFRFNKHRGVSRGRVGVNCAPAAKTSHEMSRSCTSTFVLKWSSSEKCEHSPLLCWYIRLRLGKSDPTFADQAWRSFHLEHFCSSGLQPTKLRLHSNSHLQDLPLLALACLNCTCNTILAWWSILKFGVTFFILQTSCIEKLKRQKTICAKMEQFNCINCQIACALLRELFLRSPRQSIPIGYIPNYSSISKSNFRCMSSSYVSWDFGCLALYNDRWGFHG
jgi:hypothetical protein